jgi:hypothetical protein
MSVTIYPARVDTRLDRVDVPLPATSIGPPAATVPAAVGLGS